MWVMDIGVIAVCVREVGEEYCKCSYLERDKWTLSLVECRADLSKFVHRCRERIWRTC